MYAYGGPRVSKLIGQLERSSVSFKVGAYAYQSAQARICRLRRFVTEIEMAVRIDHTVSIAGSGILGGQVMTTLWSNTRCRLFRSFFDQRGDEFSKTLREGAELEDRADPVREA